MQAPAEDCRSELLGLPPEVLRLVWDETRPYRGQAPVDQHALRCCCRALRDASTAWIDSICIQGQHHATRPALITSALAQLSCFPHQAAMHKLAWSYECEEDGHDAVEQARGLVPAFMLRAHSQLAFLRSFTLKSKSLDYGDMAALVETCPQLQSVSIQNTVVIGPAFAPLQRLRSLDSLYLCWLRTKEQELELVLSSLPALTSLTKFELSSLDDDDYDDWQLSIKPPAMLPWVGGLRQLRHLEVTDTVQEDDQGADHLVPIIIGLAGLTHLQVECCTLPSPCPPLACAPVLSKLVAPSQVLDTPLIRLFAAMPQLRWIHVCDLEPDTDLSALPCSWEELHLLQSYLELQQLLWLPRDIGQLTLWYVQWWLPVQGSVASTCTLLLGAAQLLADKPRWQVKPLRVFVMPVPTTPAAVASADSADALAAQQALQPSIWLPLIEALAPLCRRVNPLSLEYLSILNAEVAVQGARWLPGLEDLQVHPRSKGLCSFFAALGATAWPKRLSFVFAGGSDQLPDDAVETLQCMAVQRAGMGHRLEVKAGGWLTKGQLQQLNQAVAHHCKSGHGDVVTFM